MLLKVKVNPKAKENKVIKIGEGSFNVKLNVAPEKGKANKKLISILSKHLKIPKSRIKIKKGLKSRKKIIEI